MTCAGDYIDNVSGYVIGPFTLLAFLLVFLLVSVSVCVVFVGICEWGLTFVSLFPSFVLWVLGFFWVLSGELVQST